MLASTLTIVTVADSDPASAHVDRRQDCTWVQSTNYTIIRYDYDSDYVVWVEDPEQPGEGEYRVGRLVPVWGYERYKSCGPWYNQPHSHNPWNAFYVCAAYAALGPIPGLICSAEFIRYQHHGH